MNKLNTNARETLECHAVAVVKFGAKWCTGCKTLTSVLEKVEAEREYVAFFDVDLEDMDLLDFINSCNIRTIPTTLIYHYGNLRHRVAGVYTEAHLKQLIQEMNVDILS